MRSQTANRAPTGRSRTGMLASSARGTVKCSPSWVSRVWPSIWMSSMPSSVRVIWIKSRAVSNYLLMVKPHGTFRLIWVRALQRREQEVDLIALLNQPHRSARLCLTAEDDEVGFDGANVRHVERDLTAKVHEANPYIVLDIELGFKETYLCFETTDAARCRLCLACFSRRSGLFLQQLRHLLIASG